MAIFFVPVFLLIFAGTTLGIPADDSCVPASCPPKPDSDRCFRSLLGSIGACCPTYTCLDEKGRIYQVSATTKPPEEATNSKEDQDALVVVVEESTRGPSLFPDINAAIGSLAGALGLGGKPKNGSDIGSTQENPTKENREEKGPGFGLGRLIPNIGSLLNRDQDDDSSENSSKSDNGTHSQSSGFAAEICSNIFGGFLLNAFFPKTLCIRASASANSSSFNPLGILSFLG